MKRNLLRQRASHSGKRAVRKSPAQIVPQPPDDSTPPTPPPKDFPPRTRIGALERLPNEILCKIVSFVPPDDISNVKASCRFLNDLVNVNESFIAQGIIKYRYSFLATKIMPVMLSDLKDGELEWAYGMNHEWFFDMDLTERLGLCSCRQCAAKMDTIFLEIDWWQTTRDLRAKRAAKVATESSKKRKKLWYKLRNLIIGPVKRFLIPAYATPYRVEQDGFYRDDILESRKIDRFPIAPLEWVHLLKRLNIMLLHKAHFRQFWKGLYLRPRHLGDKTASDEFIRARYEREHVFLRKIGWDGQQSLLDLCFSWVVALRSPGSVHTHRFVDELRNVVDCMRLAMFFEYIDCGLSHEQLFGGEVYRGHSSLGNRRLIF